MSLDKLGITASIGCMIHCVLFPFVVPALPLIGLAHKHEGMFHLAMVGVVMVVGIPAMLIGFKKHNNPIPIIGFSLGLANLIFAGMCEVVGWHFGGMTTMITILASIAIVSSHIVNHKQSCLCVCEGRGEACH